ncbi:GCG_CRPN prefix-to-repeats domain-containing protein [Legionella drancourtii]|jgi:hypothetical protein|uniref:Uncharacterized protein n=1 Tax=Legionella drancourtii LLAP12 TaxID=658187 RepID=G9EM98_9GAMM|nr:hypothetical protein [Legionella drancourtii]EHL31698.1 hypothetical protein LDG_6362 [Legionella drancourtii LLAP12]
MNTDSMYLSKCLRTVLMVGVLGFMASYTTIASAAQGCGHGFHRNIYGRCVFNHPGPRATPAPYHRGCWRNAWGQLRCYR